MCVGGCGRVCLSVDKTFIPAGDIQICSKAVRAG